MKTENNKMTVDKTLLTVELNDAENYLDSAGQHSLVKSKSEESHAEVEYTTSRIIVPEVGVEFKVEEDHEGSKVFDEQKQITKSVTMANEAYKVEAEGEEEFREEDVEKEYKEGNLDQNEQESVEKEAIMEKSQDVPSTETQFVVSPGKGEGEEEHKEYEEKTSESKEIIHSSMVKSPKEEFNVDKTDSLEEVGVELETNVDENGTIITIAEKRLARDSKQSIESEDKINVLGKDEDELGGSTIGIRNVEHRLSDEDQSEIGEVLVDENDLEEELADEGKNKSIREKKSELDREEYVEKDYEESSEEGGEKSAVRMSSEEERIAGEKAEINEKFEILMKLRGDHIFLRRKNLSLNNKLVHYFKKHKMDYVFTEIRDERELDDKFNKKLEQFFEFNKEVMEEKININTDWESQKRVNDELIDTVKEARENLLEKKREIGSKLVDSRTGRIIHHDKGIDDMINRQDMLMRQLTECSFSQIKLRRRIDDKRRERQMQHMGNDLNLMDYEKLASLKDYYTDKITERDVEINEVKEKLTAMEDNTNQVRNRLKQAEDDLEAERLRLQNVSTDLLRKRANLNKVKATRHKTEKNTAKIKRQSGLLAYPILLKDYEDKSQQLKELSSQVESLKQNHRSGTIKMRNLRDSIRKRIALKYSST